nr:VOC family protein [Sphingomonas sp. Y57]
MVTNADANSNAQNPATVTPVVLKGVHHTARPTWKLKETVHFYRDVLDLKLCHAICARGWGREFEQHPDFIHFFFDSGLGSTIAFFYYLQTDKPVDSVPQGSFVYNSVHTAWRVDTREELLAWKDKLESQGYAVLHVPHEIVESIYVTDPNGYAVEIAWQTRDMNAYDEVDATLTLEAAIAIEDETGDRVQTTEEIWRRKAPMVDAYLSETE